MTAPPPPQHGQLCDALARGRLALAEVAAIPPRELEALYELAAQCLDVGRDAEAVDLGAALTTLFPFSARYWRAYAIALHRRLLLDRARAAYEAALVLDPQHQLTRCYRAEVLIYLGLADEAAPELAALRRAGDRAVASRAAELLAQLDRLRAWRPPTPPEEPEAGADPSADTPAFSLDGGERLPLASSTFGDPAPMREETTLTARVFLSPLAAEVTAPAAREPTHTATAIVRRRRPPEELPIVTGDADRAPTDTSLLPGRAARARANARGIVPAPIAPPAPAPPDDQLEPTHTAIVLRRLGAVLGEPEPERGGSSAEPGPGEG